MEYTICWDNPADPRCWPFGEGLPSPPQAAPIFDVVCELLCPLQQQGVIRFFSVDEESWEVRIIFSPSASTDVLDWCRASPLACVVVTGATLTIYVVWPHLKQLVDLIFMRRTARDYAPNFDRYNPGRDQNGNCNPMDPDKFVKWKGTPDLNGDHWHWIEWNQNPDSCEAFPVFRTGRNDPGARYREIPRR
jgi:hypothetical protein